MLPAPFAALLSLLLGACLAIVSDTLGLRLFRRRDAISRGLYFVGGLLGVAWITLLLCISGIAFKPVLQSFGASVIVTGMVIAWRRRSELRTTFHEWPQRRFAIWLALFGIVLALIALSPPTDADSLDYHLGLPVEILRSGGLQFDPLQLHYRMFGFGEMLNVFGLANGTASFGAFVQLMAVFFVLRAYREVVPGAGFRPAMLVFGIPALIALLPGCKHLLTGACGTTLSFLAMYKLQKKASLRDLVLPLLGIFFAVGIKYSFLISGGLLLVYCLFQNGVNTLKQLLIFAIVGVAICGPLFGFKLWRFGDPVAPFGAGALGGDPVVSWFCSFIRSYTESSWSFPLSLLAPSSLGALSSVLGWAFVILVLFLILCFRRFRMEVLLVSGLCILIVLLGQETSRFFIEPLLWVLPLFLLRADEFRWGRGAIAIGTLQFFVTLPLSMYLAWSLGRGALAPSLQQAVMRRNASFYEPAEWVNSIVPANALLRTDIRSRSLLPMPVFPIEYHYARNAGAGKLRVVDSLLENRYKVAYIAVIDPDEWFVQKYCGARVAGPKTFQNATRNPFNRGTYSMVIYRARR